jgi:hypothetical protein
MGEIDRCVSCRCERAAAVYSLPMSNGEVVDNDFTGEWGSAPCCVDCFNVHEAGGADGLRAHVKVLKMIRARYRADPGLAIELDRDSWDACD